MAGDSEALPSRSTRPDHITARTLGAAATGYITQRAAVEKKTIVQVVEDALRAYLETPGSKPGSTPPQTSGEISFGSLSGPTLPNWGGGAKKRRKS